MAVREEAINIIRKHIDIFSNNPEHRGFIKDLKHGLEVLEKGSQRRIDEGIEKFAEDLKKYPRGKRPGLGLSRGFGEFLWQGYDWQKEIMDAVRKIERYHSSM